MKYDFETIIDRDPAIRGTGKYRSLSLDSQLHFLPFLSSYFVAY